MHTQITRNADQGNACHGIQKKQTTKHKTKQHTLPIHRVARTLTALHRAAIFAGQRLAATDTTPFPPIDMSGSTNESSPMIKTRAYQSCVHLSRMRLAAILLASIPVSPTPAAGPRGHRPRPTREPYYCVPPSQRACGQCSPRPERTHGGAHEHAHVAAALSAGGGPDGRNTGEDRDVTH